MVIIAITYAITAMHEPTKPAVDPYLPVDGTISPSTK